MLRRDDLIGNHQPNGGEGITGEDLYQLLKSIPAAARRNWIMTGEHGDVTGIGIGQSDQAEKWEFKLFILLDEKTK